MRRQVRLNHLGVVAPEIQPNHSRQQKPARWGDSGRIDDRYVDFGKQRTEPTVRELRDALQAILAGKPIAVTRTKPIGCDIDFPKPRKQ